MSDMIWNGSYTLGDSQETQITAGTGIKVTTPAAGQIQISNDETVLWENTNQYPAVASISLSENWNNFKYLRVETTEQFGNGPLTNLFDTQSQSFSGGRFKRFEVGHYAVDISNSTLYIRLIMVSFANGEYKDATIDVIRVSVGNNTSSFNNGTGDTRLVRIVGINRIAGGN